MFRTMTLADALYVSQNMREEQRVCCKAMLGEHDDDTWAVTRWQGYGPAWTLLDDEGVPVAICGLSLQSPWLGIAWLVATDKMTGQSWRKLVRKARTVAANAMNPEHPQHRHRIEAHVLSTWRSASRFAARLGFTLEGVRRGAGSAGEDIEMYGMCAKDVRR